jgi:autotransporter-associated beta strand protein
VADTGTGGIRQEGSGTTILTANNTYTGTTTISSGTLELAPVSGTSTLLGNITGAGNITKSGSGTTIIAGGANGNTISGTLAVNGGTLQIGNSTTANNRTFNYIFAK